MPGARAISAKEGVETAGGVPVCGFPVARKPPSSAKVCRVVAAHGLNRGVLPNTPARMAATTVATAWQKGYSHHRCTSTSWAFSYRALPHSDHRSMRTNPEQMLTNTASSLGGMSAGGGCGGPDRDFRFAGRAGFPSGSGVVSCRAAMRATARALVIRWGSASSCTQGASGVPGWCRRAFRYSCFRAESSSGLQVRRHVNS